ncbi:MAG: metal-sulfur cluster assembly factor [Candidatus Peribacteria bacterium]|jgi:metal-sulfur cluster biosynthetic enzyme|nr:metal-sulfur cluster assembly factor [Candidatus Peribacteria bacterium]
MTKDNEILCSAESSALNDGGRKEQIETKLKTVYDPEFPLVDIFTMGLIYGVNVNEAAKKCVITMTFTTPACPMAEMMMEMVKNAVGEAVPDWEVEVVVSFEPMRTPKMIKDEDLQRMFE